MTDANPFAALAAQDAQIEGLEANTPENLKAVIDALLAVQNNLLNEAAGYRARAEAAETALAAMTKERDEYRAEAQKHRDDALEWFNKNHASQTALAAERAKVTKLVEVERAARKLEENLGVKGVDVGSLRVDLYRALAAITEAQEK